MLREIMDLFGLDKQARTALWRRLPLVPLSAVASFLGLYLSGGSRVAVRLILYVVWILVAGSTLIDICAKMSGSNELPFVRFSDMSNQGQQAFLLAATGILLAGGSLIGLLGYSVCCLPMPGY